MQHGFRKRSAYGRRGGESRRFGFLIGAVSSVVILSVLCAVFSYLFEKGTISFEQSALIGKGCFALAALIGCFLAVKLTARRKLVSASASVLLFLLAVMIGTAAAVGWEHLNVLTPIIIAASSCLTAVLFASRKKTHGYG